MKTAKIQRVVPTLVLFALVLTNLAIHVSANGVTTGCDRENFNINCTSARRQVICIEKAEVGKIDQRMCGHRPDGAENKTCKKEDILRLVDTNCHGKPECEFYVDSKKLGDHCHGAFKFFKIMHKCVKTTGSKTGEKVCTREGIPPIPTSLPPIKTSLPPRKTDFSPIPTGLPRTSVAPSNVSSTFASNHSTTYFPVEWSTTPSTVPKICTKRQKKFTKKPEHRTTTAVRKQNAWQHSNGYKLSPASLWKILIPCILFVKAITQEST